MINWSEKNNKATKFLDKTIEDIETDENLMDALNKSTQEQLKVINRIWGG